MRSDWTRAFAEAEHLLQLPPASQAKFNAKFNATHRAQCMESESSTLATTTSTNWLHSPARARLIAGGDFANLAPLLQRPLRS